MITPFLLVLAILEPGADREPATPSPETVPPPSPGPAAASAPWRVDVAALLARSQPEPTVDDLRAAATHLALVEPARARSLIARARRAPWLPEVRMRFERRFGRNEALDHDPASPLPPPIELDTVNDVRYEWRATWDLGRLVFNPDELHAHTEALRMADVRMEVESLVIRLYFERRRLQVDAALAVAADQAAEARRALRIQELEAELDALSGGLFHRARAAAGQEARPAR